MPRVLIKSCPRGGGTVKEIGIAELEVFGVSVNHLFTNIGCCSRVIEPGDDYECVKIGSRTYVVKLSKNPPPLEDDLSRPFYKYEVTIDPEEDVKLIPINCDKTIFYQPV